jgi:hypothetical protein
MSTCDPSVYRAIVASSNDANGQIFVRIPSLLGIESTIELSKIGRSVHDGVWTVPAVGTQIVVTADDPNFTNAFWVQTDAVIPPTFTYKIGDTGPGGGIIFFVDRFNDYSGFTYLEVAPIGAEVSEFTWATDVNSNQTTSVSGADSKALGAGYQNTLDIVAQTGNVAASCAAAYCADLVSGGQSDWYLPSLAEIKMVYDVLHMNLFVGGFASGIYWSSSEYSAGRAYSQFFNNGAQFDINKGNPEATYVRPVRKF